MPFDDDHAVRPLEVVAQRGGPGDGAVGVGAREQLVEQVAAQPQLALGQAAHPGQLHREHRGAVFERHQLLVARAAGGVDEHDHAERVALRVRDRQQPGAVADRPPLLLGPREQPLPARRGVLRVRVGRRRPGPGLQVAVPVLDRDLQPGELVHGAGDALPPLTGDGHGGEPGVDVHAAPQRADAPPQPLVERRERGRGGLLLGVQAPVGQRAAHLLGERPQQELLLARRLAAGPHDEVPEMPRGAVERERPRPPGAGQRDGPAGDARRPQLRGQAGRGGRTADQLHAHDVARGQRRARRWWPAGGSAARRRPRS